MELGLKKKGRGRRSKERRREKEHKGRQGGREKEAWSGREATRQKWEVKAWLCV